MWVGKARRPEGRKAGIHRQCGESVTLIPLENESLQRTQREEKNLPCRGSVFGFYNFLDNEKSKC